MGLVGDTRVSAVNPAHVAIVVPCYNERATLGNVVATCSRFGTVLVIDDGSTDGSADIAWQNGGTVLKTAGHTGYDGAIEHGLRAAFDGGYALCITIDADGEHDPSLIEDFIRAFSAGHDLTVGIRPRPQRLAEWLVCGYCAYRFGIKDVLCGMKGMSRAVLETYFEDSSPNLVNTWPSLVWRASGGDLKQIPVTGERRADVPRFKSLVRANIAIAAMLPKIHKLPCAGHKTKDSS